MFKTISFVVPFFLGLVGYMQLPDYGILDAVYSSIRLYALSVDTKAINEWIQLGRFGALLVASNVLYLIVRNLGDVWKKFSNWFKLSWNISDCVVYGNSAHTEQLIKNRSIIGSNEFISNAPKHIIMLGSDNQNLDFYMKNNDKLTDKKVYMLLEEIHAQSIKDPNITVFGMHENAARLFWENNPVMCNRKIGIIGFGDLGEDILTFGLCKNIFSPEQNIEYHIWGDSGKFRRTHTKLDKIDMDRIIFHNANWEDDIASEKFAELDSIVLCDKPDDNIKILSNLLIYAPLKEEAEIFAYSPSSETISKLFGNKAKAFGTTEEISKAEVILKGELLNNAKNLHEHYKSKYPNMPAWEELNNFTRYSNISAADFFSTLRRLHDEGKSIEFLSELEHIRWARYHYLNNWDYAEKSDKAKKRHSCLVPFANLSPEEKKKDQNNVEIAIQSS